MCTCLHIYKSMLVSIYVLYMCQSMHLIYRHMFIQVTRTIQTYVYILCNNACNDNDTGTNNGNDDDIYNDDVDLIVIKQ